MSKTVRGEKLKSLVPLARLERAAYGLRKIGEYVSIIKVFNPFPIISTKSWNLCYHNLPLFFKRWWEIGGEKTHH